MLSRKKKNKRKIGLVEEEANSEGKQEEEEAKSEEMTLAD